MGKPLLGYWDLRGLAEPIRFLLHYKKVDFEDNRYDLDKDDWEKDKFNLGLDFPNLPYLMDGDVKITQSTAILRYLARKHGLGGKDEEQKLRVSVAEQQIVDLRRSFYTLVMRDDYDETVKDEYIKKIPDLLKLWENFIGDHKYSTGDDITYVDFMAYEVFDFHRLFHAEVLDDFPKIKAFHNRIKNLPELQKYFRSSTCKKWPVFGPFGKWSGGKAPKHL